MVNSSGSIDCGNGPARLGPPWAAEVVSQDEAVSLDVVVGVILGAEPVSVSPEPASSPRRASSAASSSPFTSLTMVARVNPLD